MNSKARMKEILRRLEGQYGMPGTALRYRTPFELLAATILSAQTPDASVNKATEGLFKKYPSIKDFAEAPIDELETAVRSINFYKTKAKNIRMSAQIILDKFDGKVPGTMEELITLPGVARKTANIVLSEAYGIMSGIAVDTHVKRLSARLGLTSNEDPVKIEVDLMNLVPKADWRKLSNLLISHGRAVCQARKPAHDICKLYDICPSRDM